MNTVIIRENQKRDSYDRYIIMKLIGFMLRFIHISRMNKPTYIFETFKYFHTLVIFFYFHKKNYKENSERI